jgi:hypothetical protein
VVNYFAYAAYLQAEKVPFFLIMDIQSCEGWSMSSDHSVTSLISHGILWDIALVLMTMTTLHV